ncbi:MAG: host attachment protein [Gammaproteobacteria bacterium]|jgi:protein required for attachment to host cells
MKKQKTWIVVADGSKAKVFLDAGGGKIELKSETAVPHPPSRDIDADRPGRTFDSGGQGRHAMEPPTDPHEKAEADFLNDLAKDLNAAHEKKAFDQLIVIAPPRALGVLRAAYGKQLAKAVAQEVTHDLTGFETPALETYLKDHEII